MAWQDYIPKDIATLYEVHDYHHAAAVIANEFPDLFDELMGALRAFRVTKADILAAGGNESSIPKIVSNILRPLGWSEEKLQAELTVDGKLVRADSHWVDFVKAEWHSIWNGTAKIRLLTETFLRSARSMSTAKFQRGCC